MTRLLALLVVSAWAIKRNPRGGERRNRIAVVGSANLDTTLAVGYARRRAARRCRRAAIHWCAAAARARTRLWRVRGWSTILSEIAFLR